MITLLPYPSFAHSAAALDDRLLSRQRVDAMRLMALLDGDAGLPALWSQEPVVEMWQGHRSALGVYLTLVDCEMVRRGRSSVVTPYSPTTWLRHAGYPGELDADARLIRQPPWVGNSILHESHRRALMYWVPEHYRQFGWRVVPRLDVWWPTRPTPQIQATRSASRQQEMFDFG